MSDMDMTKGEWVLSAHGETPDEVFMETGLQTVSQFVKWTLMGDPNFNVTHFLEKPWQYRREYETWANLSAEDGDF